MISAAAVVDTTLVIVSTTMAITILSTIANGISSVWS